MIPTSPSSTDVLIAVMGETGSGKSQFINLATGSNLPVSPGARSCTQEVTRAGPLTLDGRQVYLFDTPGFDDTDRSESEILRTIAIALESQYRQKQILHGIIYLHRISDIRVGGMAKANFGVFRKLCGESTLGHVVIVTNMWSKVDQKAGDAKSKELASMNDFFGYAITKGATMKDNNPDTVETAHGIIRGILEKHPVVLDIQKEIVDRNLDINQTSAGMALEDKLEQLAKRYELKLKEQLEAAEAARKERDEETRKEQEEEAQRVRKILEKLQQERREQAEQYKKLQKHLEEKMKELNLRNDAAPAKQGISSAQAGHEGIVSGQSYSLYNKQHGLYATVHGSKIVLQENRGARDSYQQWRFHSDGPSRWRIESVHTRKFMSVTASNLLRMHATSSSWCLASGTGLSDDEYRICYNGDDTRGDVIACERRRVGTRMVGKRLDLFNGQGGSDEIWAITKA